MKKSILIITILMAFCTNVIAQEQQEKKKKNRFSVEEFQACQTNPRGGREIFPVIF